MSYTHLEHETVGPLPRAPRQRRDPRGRQRLATVRGAVPVRAGLKGRVGPPRGRVVPLRRLPRALRIPLRFVLFLSLPSRALSASGLL